MVSLVDTDTWLTNDAAEADASPAPVGKRMAAMVRGKAGGHRDGFSSAMADAATVLWSGFHAFDAADPSWPDRDRLVISDPDGAALLTALQHTRLIRADTVEGRTPHRADSSRGARRDILARLTNTDSEAVAARRWVCSATSPFIVAAEVMASIVGCSAPPRTPGLEQVRDPPPPPGPVHVPA